MTPFELGILVLSAIMSGGLVVEVVGRCRDRGVKRRQLDLRHFCQCGHLRCEHGDRPGGDNIRGPCQKDCRCQSYDPAPAERPELPPMRVVNGGKD